MAYRRRAAGVAVAVLACASGCSGAQARGHALSPAPGHDARHVPTVAARSGALRRRLRFALYRTSRALHAPGVSAAVVVRGRVVWQAVVGKADVARGKPVTPATLFITASTAKSITAALILRLVEEGRLGLDDTVAALYPKLPGADRITARILLLHRSGLPDYTNDPAFNQLIRVQPYHGWTRDEVIALVHSLRFAPGSQYEYSNTGFVVAGGVIEHAVGASIESTFQRVLGRPLALHESTFAYHPVRSREFAHPYTLNARGRLKDAFPPRGIVPTYDWGEVWTDGGLATTAPELARMTNAIYAGNVLSPASLAQMLRFNSNGVGLGTDTEHAAGATWVGHNGSFAGYESDEWTDRRRGLTIAVMTNVAEPASASYSISGTLWRALARAY
jgi:D-alanyl-D-alanine carboxypeptidase